MCLRGNVYAEIYFISNIRSSEFETHVRASIVNLRFEIEEGVGYKLKELSQYIFCEKLRKLILKRFFPKRPLGLRVFSTRFGSDDVCGYGYVGACRVGSGR